MEIFNIYIPNWIAFICLMLFLSGGLALTFFFAAESDCNPYKVLWEAFYQYNTAGKIILCTLVTLWCLPAAIVIIPIFLVGKLVVTGFNKLFKEKK